MAKKKIVESDSDSSDNDSATTPAAAAKPQHMSASKPPPTSSSESGSGSESDSEGSNRKDSLTPTQAKDKSTNGGMKSRSKSSAADPVTLTKSAAKKRPADDKNTGAKPKKKAQPESSEKKSTDTPKKSIIQRIWSEEDEAVILQGMIDYKAEKKADPAADMNDFHAFIQKNLSIKNFDKLQGKISTLKRKYKNNKIKEEKDGKERTFSKPHERKVYGLSKSVWENKEEAAMKSIAEERVLKVGAENFENGKGNAGQRSWKKLMLEEMQANLRLLEVKTAQARLVVGLLQSQGI